MGTNIYNGWTYSTEGPTCPYCTTTITPDDGSYYDEHSLEKLTCPVCDEVFSAAVTLSASWRTRKLGTVAEKAKSP
jgi:uncharacterized protein (DUF2225 family)